MDILSYKPRLPGEEAGENWIITSFINCTLHQNMVRAIKSRNRRPEEHGDRM
jgi:hypothetical protein